MHRLMILAVFALSACVTTEAGLGVNFGADGVEVSPSLSGSSGNATFSISG